MTLTLSICVVLAIGLILALGAVNALSEHRQRIRLAWSAMDEQLRRRAALLSNLPESNVELIGKVRECRNRAAVALNHEQLASAERELSDAVRAVLDAHTGSVPALHNAETQIGQARQRYNDAVGDYNAAVHSFPGMLVATAFGFGPMTEF